MQHKDYWAKRFEQLTEAQLNKGAEYYHNLQEQYRKAIQSVEKDIAKWYTRYATENGISLTEAKRLLNSRELEEFRMDVEEYIKKGKTLKYSNQWAKQLEAASVKVHVSRLEALKVQMQQQAETMYAYERDGIDELARNVYTDGYYRTAYEVQKGIGVGFDMMRLDTNRIDKLIAKPWAADGKNFSERIWNNRAQLVSELENRLTQSIIRGQSPKKVIAEIAGRFNVNKSKAGRLVMTESAFFASASQRDAFKDLDVERYEVLATLDSRTSPVCRAMDGKVMPMSDYKPGVTAPPFHVYCRSTTVPFFDDEFTIDEQRAARGENGEYYTVPASMKYEDWKKTFVDGGSKDGLILQEFKPVTFGKAKTAALNGKNYDVKKIETSKYEAYVSDDVKLKPKQLHYFENNITKALKVIGVKDTSKMPKFYMVSSQKMATGALARFNAKENTLMLDVSFCDKQKLLAMQVGSACAENEISTAVHELLHWKDAQEYIKKYGSITNQNKYIEYLIEKHGAKVEKLAEKGYNLYEISSYANRMIVQGRFDEVYTEYRVKQSLEG